MDALAGDRRDDLLPVLAQLHALQRKVWIFFQYADDVALFRIAAETEQQVGRGQMEEMQCMRLQRLAEMQQTAQLGCCRRELLHADQLVHRFGRRELVADRADAAQPLHEERHFPIGASLDEFLEAAEFDDVETRFVNMILSIEHQRDLAVSPSTRETGSIATRLRLDAGISVLFHNVLSLIVMDELFRQRRFAARQQIAEHAQELVGGWWHPGR